ncbi:MAG: oligosaccharide flippase family protein [Paracoccaceae bacterium]|nr:oligosaccharide flippase family protein [Paracoccaceae bacterium]
MLRIALIILSGSVMSSALNLLRNLGVARLVSVSDYGIAATFAMSLAVVEMMSALGLPQQLVQDRDGDNPRMQAAMHGLQAMRGVVGSVLLFLLATPLARFLGTPEVIWAYRLLAVVPLLRGFQHLDPVRMHRRMRYLPSVLSDVVPIFLSVAAIVPLFLIYHDYRVMLYALLIQSGTILIATHLLAERPYRIAFDPEIGRSSLRFGWPLMVEGVMLFAVFNGDKMIVGREMGMGTLALFAMGQTLTLTPALILAGTAAKFFLPQLSAAKKGEAFEHLAAATIEAHLLFSGIVLLGVSIVGPPFVHFVLGPKYAGLAPLLIWFGILNALWVVKGGSGIVSLARAHSGNALIGNIMRVGLLPVSFIIAAGGAGPESVIQVAILGELLGALVALRVMRNQLKLPIGRMMHAMVLSLLTFMPAFFMATFDRPHHMSQISYGGLVMMIALFVLSVRSMHDLRRYLRNRQLTRHDPSDAA